MLNRKVRDYFDLAKRKGWKIVSHSQEGKHIKVEVISPSGTEFTTTVASTPSDYRGVFNWIQHLKRAEAKVIENLEKNKSMLDIKRNAANAANSQDIAEAKKVLRQMAEDTDLLLLAYRSSGRTFYQWYLNKTRATHKGPVSSKVALWLMDEKYIQHCETVKLEGGTKEIYSVSQLGLESLGKVKVASKVETAPVEPEQPFHTPPPIPYIQDSIAVVREALEERPKTTLTATETLILDAFKGLSDETIKQVLYYGINMVKDDLEKELKKKTETLDALEEKLSLI